MNGLLHNAGVDSKFVAILLVFTSIEQTVQSKLQMSLGMFTEKMSDNRDLLLIASH